MKIGITFEPPESPTGIFSNGIKQNALFLNELLVNIGFDSRLLVPKGDVSRLDGLYGFDSEKYKWSVWENVLNDGYDVVIQFTFQIPVDDLVKLKSAGIKLVAYKCGNDYFIDTEEVLHSARERGRIPQYSALKDHPGIFDQVWSIPQMVNTNHYYWKTLFKSEVIDVPFVWSPTAIEQFESECKRSGIESLLYKNRGEKKKIAIFEPNINVFKWYFPALLVCENAYRKISNKINHVFITNIPKTNEKFNLELMNDSVRSLDLNDDKKISTESRYNSLYFMSAYSDIAVSHQWENPLNYLYLDLAWMGWPIVHNANLCKDVGYYYEGFDYQQGGNVLKSVILNHDKDSNGYLEKNRKAIDRFLPTNKKLQNSYKELFENLFK